MPGRQEKVRKRQICSNERSKTKNIGRETVKTARRGSEIAGGQLEGTQQEDKRNIRTGEMNGNRGGKPAQQSSVNLSFVLFPNKYFFNLHLLTLLFSFFCPSTWVILKQLDPSPSRATGQ